MITLKDFPYWAAETLEEIRGVLREICNVRKDDIAQFQTLQSIFIAGRKTGRIPSGSADVLATDKVGDVNYEWAGATPYLYILIDDAGTPTWARFTGGAF